jgi:hypothetical protein
VCHVSLPSSYRSRRGHIHLLRVLPLVGCRSKTPTHGLEDAVDGSPRGTQQPACRCLVVPSPHSVGDGDAVPGMVLGQRGWSHRTDGDGGDRSRRPDVTASSSCGRGVVVRLPFEASAVLFRGCGASAIREWVAQCHGVAADHAAQRHIVAGMSSPGELAEQCRGVIPRCVVAWIRL